MRVNNITHYLLRTQIRHNTTLMLWRLQYATKGRNSFVTMYALDLSPNGNTVKNKISFYIQENHKKV